MRKKRMTVILTIMGILLLVPLWYLIFLLTGFGPKPPFVRPKPLESNMVSNLAEGKELMALVESQEEAEQVAEMYDIIFVSFGDGVALYTTDRDPATVVKESEEKGGPALYLNQMIQFDIEN